MTSAASTHSDEPAGPAQMKRRKSEVRALLPFLLRRGASPSQGRAPCRAFPTPRASRMTDIAELLPPFT